MTVQMSCKMADGTIVLLAGENPKAFMDQAADLDLNLQTLAGRFKVLEGLSDPVTTAAVANATAGLGAVAYNPPAQANRNNAPANDGIQIPQPPGPVPNCAHGPRAYVSKIGKNNKPYAAWFCGAAQGATDKCQPEFVSTR